MTAGTRRRNSGFPRWLAAAIVIVLIATVAGGGVALKLASPAEAAPASILGWSPGLTRDAPLAAPLTVYFSRGMARSSVERAWRLAPSMPGSFRWSDTSVSFHPDRLLRPGSAYRLTLGPGARDDQGKPLTNSLSVAFTTGDPLKVTGFTPANATAGVPLNGLIAITFNHPMTVLGGLEARTPDPPGWRVSISPATAGQGSWLGTSTWVFHPQNGLVPSSSYAVTVPGAVRDAWGEPLGQTLRWTFRTVDPEVIGQSPAPGVQDADPRGRVQVTFNQPMDPASITRAFSLHAGYEGVSTASQSAPGGAPVAGTVAVQGQTLTFRASSPLNPSMVYTATVGASALSASGTAALGQDVSWSFHVAAPPQVISTNPAPDATASSFEVDLHFSSPMVGSSLDRHLMVSPPLGGMSTSTSGPNGPSDSTVYTITGSFQPSTAYAVTIGAGAQDRFGRALVSPYTLRFHTAPLQPSVSLYGMPGSSQAIAFSAGQVVNAPVQLVNVAQVHYTLVHTTLEAAATNTSSYGTPLSAPTGDTVRDWTASVAHPLNGIENLGVRMARPDGSPLPAGVYWLGAQAPTVAALSGAAPSPPASSELVLVSNVGVTMKTGGGQVLVWVTSARDGLPASGVPVTLLDDKGYPVADANTNARGLALFRIDPNMSLLGAVVEDGAHFGAALTSWQTPVSTSGPSQFTGSYAPPPTGTYAYTDRPIYRPGQTVFFRAVLWKDRDGAYSPYRGQTTSVTAVDGSGQSLYHGQAVVDRFGSVTGRFRLPAGASTGYGQIEVGLPGARASGAGVSTGTSFAIASYRKPEFLTDVSTDRPSYIQGQTIAAIVRVRYVFGAPVVGQQVTWTAYTQNRYQPPPGWDLYSFGDLDAMQQAGPSGPGGGETPLGTVLTSGTGTTDAQGNLTVRLPVDLSKKLVDQTVTIEATTTDVNHQSVSGRVRVPTYKSAVEVGLLPALQVVSAGQQDRVEVATVRTDGSAAPNVSLTARIYRRTYTSRLADSGFGSGIWLAVPHDRLLQTQGISTDGGGGAAFTFTAGSGGDYYVAVEGKDGQGNTAHSALSIYAASSTLGTWGTSSSAALQLKPDRASYRVGQTAHIMVPAPFRRGTALVTVERGAVRSYRVQQLGSGSPVVDVPISTDDIPNVFVTVTLYRGWQNGSPPEWRYGVASVPVSVDPRRLVVHLSQDRAHYHPGDRVRYTVTTTDFNGRPASAELSLALVDTAVLALQDDLSPSILTALYGQRSLDVITASDGTVAIDHLRQQPGFQIRPGGGAGGGGGPGGPVAYLAQRQSGAARVRHRFEDTAYWSGNVFTNASGRAAVDVTLPDNLTTWRLDARGITADGRVGSAQLTTLSTQDIVLRPVAPRFLLQGDTLQLGAVVNNNLSTSVDLTVSLAASGLSLQSSSSTGVTVPAHGERLLLWQVNVPESSVARLTFRASPSSSSVQGDAVAVTLPVHPPLTAETVATSGQVFGSVHQPVAVPADALSKPGALTVEVTSALTDGLGRAWSSFTPTPYDSNEEIAARVLTGESLLSPSLTGLSARQVARIRAQLGADLAGLTRRENPDGGWPWFTASGAASDPTITTDVVEALSAAGDPALRTPIRQGAQYLVQQLGRMAPAEAVHAALVVHGAGQATSGFSLNSVQRAHLDPAALADLAWVSMLQGNLPAARSDIASLDAEVMVSATGAHWEGAGVVGPSSSAVRTTAEALRALVALAPRDPLLPDAARWLMLARQGAAWGCPCDSARAVAALAAYANAAHEGPAGYAYRVLVDGNEKLSGRYVRGRAPRAAFIRVPVAGLHRGGTSTLLVERSSVNSNLGPGPMYYVAGLQYFLRANAIKPLDRGVAVSRRYLSVSGQPISSAPAGSVVRVELTVRTGQTLTYLDLDDPIPAGVEPIDRSLNTSQQGLFKAELSAPGPGASDLSPYLTHVDIRDDRVSLYAVSLPPGTYTYSYLAQATVSGHYAVAPVRASEAFFPEVFGRGSGQVFDVK